MAASRAWRRLSPSGDTSRSSKKLSGGATRRHPARLSPLAAVDAARGRGARRSRGWTDHGSTDRGWQDAEYRGWLGRSLSEQLLGGGPSG